MKNKKFGTDFLYLLKMLNPFTSTISVKDDLSGFQLDAYKADLVGRVIFKTGYWEKSLSKWIINRFGDQGENFIDVGANLGYHTCLFSKLAANRGKVLAIEPEPMNLELLRNNIKRNHITNVEVLPIALGSEELRINLNIHKTSNRGRHSIVMPGSGVTLEVPVRKLDDVADLYFPNNQLVSLIKIDVEGYEPYVLNGGQRTIDRTQCLVMEFIPKMMQLTSTNIENLFTPLFAKFNKVYAVSDEDIFAVDLDLICSQSVPLDLIFDR